MVYRCIPLLVTVETQRSMTSFGLLIVELQVRETAVYNRSQIHTITLVKESSISDELPERKKKTHFKCINWIQTRDQNLSCPFHPTFLIHPRPLPILIRRHTPSTHEMNFFKRRFVLFCFVSIAILYTTRKLTIKCVMQVSDHIFQLSNLGYR